MSNRSVKMTAHCRRCLLAIMCLLVFQLANAQSYNPTGNILYVDQHVGTAGDGSSWDHAIRELADALKWTAENRSSWSASGPLKIYVAKGTYKPKYSPRDDAAFADEGRDNTFLVVPNVQLYGGFDPVNDIESLDDQRILPGQGASDPEAGTILSGDIGEEGDDGDNTYHVVVAADDISTARLDGFFITDGNANGSEEIDISGLQTRQYRGGGIYNAAPSTTSSSPVMANLAILSNRADDGADVFNDYGAPRFINVIISGNEASYVGGGMYNWESSAELVNVRVTGNRARVYEGGGIVHEGYESHLKLTNVTISGNSADGDGYTDGDGIGGGLYVASGLSVEAVNTILWGNVTEVEGTEVYAEAGAAITFRYSLVAGITAAYDGGNNLPGNVNPRFVAAPEVPDAGAEEHFAPFTNGDYNLQARSPAVDAGDPATDLSLFPGGPDNPLDLAGASRVYQPDGGGIIDLGAYEYQAEAEPVTDPPEQVELSLPADEEESIGLSPVLSWQEAEGADTYTVQFSTDGSFSSPAGTVVAGLTGLEYTVEAPLLSQTTYYWRVRAENGVGDGEWSDVWKFTTLTEIAPGAGNILYVNQSATGSGTGSSWTDAIPELADALQWAREQWGDDGTDGGWGVGNPLQIQVAAGTYRAKYSVRDDEQDDPENPENPGDRSFVLPPYLHLYGGYSPSGDGTQDIQGNETILSGDLDGDGTFSAGDAYHVLIVAGDVGTTMLDGFTVTGGNANGEGTAEVYGEPLERNYGAGLVFSALYADDFEPAVLNLTVSKNRAVQVGSNPGYGGGIYSYYSTYDGGNWPRLQDITVTDNEADYGGGIYVDSWSSPHFRRVVISRNTATEYGGGMYINRSSTPTILEGAEIKGNAAGVSGGGLVNSGWASVTNAIVNGNTAEYGGGIDNSNGAEFTLVNAVVSSNMASSLGGGVYAIYGNATARLVNVTISGNDADTGGGIYAGEQSTVSVANSIVWGNTANDEGHEIYVERYGGNNGTVELETTLYGNEVNDVEGSGTIVLGVGLMTADPRFRNVDDENSADYLRLALSSPAINAGNNTYYADAGRNLSHDTDVAGNPRVYDLANDGIIDLGAYESWYPAVSPTDGVLYVDIDVDTGKGPGDVLSDQSGSSWENAVPELADALRWAREQWGSDGSTATWDAANPLKIFVAEGTYRPLYNAADGLYEADGGRDNAFVLLAHVAVYGGFAGTETSTDARSPDALAGHVHKTVLSGDFNDDDNPDDFDNHTENAHHVVIFPASATGAVLDGFTVSGGNADGGAGGIAIFGHSGYDRRSGGGIINHASSTVKNVSIRRNRAADPDGGLPKGAGVFNDGNATYTRVTIADNIAVDGAGGAMATYGSPTLTDMIIRNNSAKNGAGMIIRDTPILINVVINGNTLLDDDTDRAGGIYNDGNYNPRFTNVTISDNSGAAIFNGGGFPPTSGITLHNCIVWGGIAGMTGTSTVRYSLIEGNSSTADGNRDATDLTAADIFRDPAAGDYRLRSGSLAIDAGSNDLYEAADGDEENNSLGNDFDITGNPRVFDGASGGIIDMGAFEYQPAEQAITLADIEKTYGDEPFEPGATADSGLPVSYSSGDNSIAEVFEDTEDGNTWKIRIVKAGEVTITASQTGNSEYLPADDETFKLTITRRAVEIGFAPDVPVEKEYDGTAAAAVSAAQLAFGTDNVLEGDDLSITLDDGGTATYGSADVGMTKSVTLPVEQVSLGGADAANYVIGNTEDITGTVGTVTPRELTVRTAAIGKEYDGTAGATVTFEPFNAADGLVGSDAVMVNFAGTAAYDSPDAGNGKAVTLSALPTLDGTEATNYTLTLPGLRGDITLRPVQVGFAQDAPVTKVYDGTVTATVDAEKLAFGAGDVLDGDDLIIALADGTAAYDNPAVGTEKEITLRVEQVSLAGADAGNYVIGNTADIAGAVGSITPAAITGITFGGRAFTYDGNAHSLAVEGLPADATVSYEENGQVNAGAYTVTAHVERPNHLDMELEALLTIRKAQATINAAAVQTHGYDGTVKDVVAVLNHSETALTYAPQQGYTDAGTYRVTVSAEETANYLGVSDEVTLVVEKADIEGVTFADEEFTYDGNAHSLVVEGLPADATVNYEENGQVNAGTYTVTAYVKQPNHATRELTATLTIKKARPVITAAPAQTHVYDGTEKTIAVGVQPAELQGYLQYSPQRSFINVGNHHVRIYLNESVNYLPAEAWVDFTVTAAPQLGLRLPDLTVTYDGEPHSLAVEGLPADATVAYEENGQVNAGSYTVKAVVSRPNHEDITLASTLYINKAVAAITAKAEQEYVFDGTAKVVEAALNHNEAALDYLPQHAFTDVGTYNVAIVVAETANYHAAIAKVKLRILPAEQSGPFMVNQSVTYNGQPHGLSVGGLSPDADVAYTINGTTGNRATDAGVYEVVAVVSRPNYVDEVLSAMLTIDRAEAFLFGDENQVHPYDGTAKSLAVVLNHEEAVPAYIPQQSFVDVGTYTINVSAPQTPNYRAAAKTFTLRIDRAKVSGVTLADSSFVFDGRAKSLTFKGVLPVGTTISYTGNSRLDAGSQLVTATISGSNYAPLILTAQLKVTPALRNIDFPALPVKTYGDGAFDPRAMASSSETVAYTSSDPSVAEVTASGMIRIVGAGTTTIIATLPENSNYGNRPEVSRELVVRKAPQTISFNAPAEVIRNVTEVPLTATASSGLPVSLHIDDPEVATLEGTMLLIHRLGTVRITATQEGDGNYEPAELVTVAVRVMDPAADFPIRVSRAVSPNGDGINEYLVIEGIKEYPENRMHIFNRNGTIVYEASGYNNGSVAFRGIGTGQHKVPAGTYFYVVEIRVNGEWKYEKGWFVLRY